MLEVALDLITRGLEGLPRQQTLAFGERLASLWFHRVPVRRAWTEAHLRCALGVSPERARELSERVFLHQTLNVIELFSLREALDHVTTHDSHLREAAIDQGQGLIVLTAHIGNVDLLAVHQAQRIPVHVVSKRLSQPTLNRFWMQTRARHGLGIIDEAVLSSALGVLKQKQAVAFVLDQHSTEPRALEATFLGLPARTTSAPATIAVRSGAPILPCFIRRDDAGEHHITFRPHFYAHTTGSLRDRIAATTRACIEITEHAILEAPEHWLWLHRRWKDAKSRPLVTRAGALRAGSR